jgi:RNA-directed DNA polymerase
VSSEACVIQFAQEVARRYLEPILEPVFHTDSYGYRPDKSAIDAVGKVRERCWRYDCAPGWRRLCILA